jgi:hypothetical protein
MYNDEQDDLDRYLASQQAPNLDLTPSAAGAQAEQQPGTWARAAQMLGGQGRNSAPDPAPKQSGLDSWSTILGMLASKDPGSVLAQDAAGRRQAVDAWQRRQSSRDDAAFGRQAQAAGLLMHEDAAKRAQASEQFNQDRATANDISAAANTDWQRQHTEGRDQVSDQHWSAGNDLAQTGQDATIENMQASRALQERGLTQADAHFGQSQSGMDRRQQAQIAAQIGMNDADNATALAAAAAKAKGAAVAPIPGTHVTDPVAYQQYMGSPANIKDATEHVGRANQVREYVSQLRDLLKADRSAANEASYNSIIKQLIGDRSQEGSTGVLSNTEFARYIEDLPEYGATGGLKNWRSALETMQGKNPRLSMLDALDGALQKGQGAKFGAYGFQMGDGPVPAAPPGGAPAAAPQSPPPFKLEDDEDLGVTYGR